MAVSPDGSIFVVDTENHAIRRIDGKTWVITTIDGSLARPHGAVVSADGSLLVGDSEHADPADLTWRRVRSLMRQAAAATSGAMLCDAVPWRCTQLQVDGLWAALLGPL